MYRTIVLRTVFSSSYFDADPAAAIHLYILCTIYLLLPRPGPETVFHRIPLGFCSHKIRHPTQTVALWNVFSDSYFDTHLAIIVVPVPVAAVHTCEPIRHSYPVYSCMKCLGLERQTVDYGDSVVDHSYCAQNDEIVGFSVNLPQNLFQLK